jgi:hypothetical protein
MQGDCHNPQTAIQTQLQSAAAAAAAAVEVFKAAAVSNMRCHKLRGITP